MNERGIMVKKSSMLLMTYLLACVNLFMSKAYISGIYYLDWIAIEIIIIFFVASFRSVPRRFNDEEREFNLCIIFIVLMNLVHILFTYFKYGQPLSIGLKISYHYFLLFAFFSFKKYFQSVEKICFLKKTLVKFVLLCNIFFLFRYFITGNTGCPHFYLLLLSVPISMSYILYKNNYYLGICSFFSSILVRVFLSTNMAFVIIVSFVVAIQMLAYFYDNYIQSRNIIMANLIIVVVIIILISFGIIEFFINSVINHDIGTQVRVLAIEYYTGKLVDSPIFGIGNLDPNYNSILYEIVRGGVNRYGGTGQYYFEDIGIIGFVCQYGLISLIPIYYMLLGTIKSIRASVGVGKIQSIGVFAMFIGMFISLMPFNKAPIQIIPLAFIILSQNVKQNYSKRIEM